MAQGAPAMPASRGYFAVEASTARRIVVHLQRACKHIAELRAAHPEALVKRDLDLMVAQLHARLLVPLFRLYPELKSARATDDLPPTSRPDPKHPVRLMGPMTAVHLRWTLNQAEKLMSSPVLGRICEKAKDKACLDPLSDLEAEIGAAAGPAYTSYPGLFVEEMRWRHKTNREPRTAKSDEAFRKNAPPPGAVTVSPAAMAVARRFLEELRHDIGPGCRVASFLWHLGARSKGPDDKDWKETGPGIGLGSFDCDQVPPDIIRRVDGVTMIFVGDTPERLSNKTIDRENGKLVLKDRGVAPAR